MTHHAVPELGHDGCESISYEITKNKYAALLAGENGIKYYTTVTIQYTSKIFANAQKNSTIITIAGHRVIQNINNTSYGNEKHSKTTYHSIDLSTIVNTRALQVSGYTINLSQEELTTIAHEFLEYELSHNFTH